MWNTWSSFSRQAQTLGKNEKGHDDDDEKDRYQDHFLNKVTSIHQSAC